MVLLAATFIFINFHGLLEYLPASRNNEALGKPRLSVLSYNTGFYNEKPETYSLKDHEQTFQEWLMEVDADVICLQESVHESLRDNFKKSEKYPFKFFLENTYGLGGLTILSKYKFIEQGVIFQGDWKRYNGAIYVDIRIGDDTLRVINVHLHSMGLFNPFATGYFARTIKNNLNAIRVGALIRRKQIIKLNQFLNSTEIPMIMCADLNETAHSFGYNLISKKVTDTFFESGNGFGFTLNKPFLNHLRIDYHFHNDRIHPHILTVFSNIEFSQHFPVYGIYEVK